MDFKLLQDIGQKPFLGAARGGFAFIPLLLLIILLWLVVSLKGAKLLSLMEVPQSRVIQQSDVAAATMRKMSTLPDISDISWTGERSDQSIGRTAFEGGTTRAYGPSSSGAETLRKNATLPDIGDIFLTGERSDQLVGRAAFEGGVIRAYGLFSVLAETL